MPRPIGASKGEDRDGPAADAGAEGEAGFASVDALVALSILAVTITLALGAAVSARRVSAAGLEATRARAVLGGLMNGPVQPPGVYRGRTPDFSWRVEISQTGPAPAPVELCRRRAEVRAIRSNRRYSYETRAVCREEASS